MIIGVRGDAMYRSISRLIMFRELGQDSIITNLGNIIRDMEKGDYDKDDIVSRIYGEIHKILEISTSYGFDKNLWYDYITYVLVTNENPFTLTCERAEIEKGSVNSITISDMMNFIDIYKYDFSKIEKELDIDCFTTITHYQSVHKRQQVYNRNVSKRVRKLSDEISATLEDESADKVKCAEKILGLLMDFYKAYGVGMLGLNKAFRIIPADEYVKNAYDGSDGGSEVHFTPIKNTDNVVLDDLIGYDIQKQKLRDNTEAFVKGLPSHNVLLFGDAGTGKSTSIKALINEYYDVGLRMIELYKHQMGDLSAIISRIKNRNYRFIIYMDDLSFEENETEYKYLKAVIEGGLETRPDNVLIYATSNRRNLIRETWNDINDLELDKHHSDTVQEKLSLVSRFGVTIGYIRPNKKEFDEIIRGLAAKQLKVQISEEELLKEATKWDISHGGMSGRSAQHFIDYMNAMEGLKDND